MPTGSTNRLTGLSNAITVRAVGRQLFSDDGPGSELTPMGQVDSVGAFARGLGPRRVKVALVVIGGILLLVAVIGAVR